MNKELSHHLNYEDDSEKKFPEDEILGENLEEDSEDEEMEEDDEFSEE